MSDVASGVLEVGLTADGQVVMNHPKLDVDEDGVGFILFSPAQARNLGDILLRKAYEAEQDAARSLRLAATAKDGDLTTRLGPAPKHAFEVMVSIGADDWAYVLRTMRELRWRMEERGAQSGTCSGGAGGCHFVIVDTRAVTPEQYHLELERWAGRA